jgi:hypothetical protein
MVTDLYICSLCSLHCHRRIYFPESVLLYWPKVLLMVGPNGGPVQYNYDEPIKLIPKNCDGVRILSNSSMEFLHRIPDSTTLVFVSIELNYVYEPETFQAYAQFQTI